MIYEVRVEKDPLAVYKQNFFLKQYYITNLVLKQRSTTAKATATLDKTLACVGCSGEVSSHMMLI